MFKNINYNNASQKRLAKFALIKYLINFKNYGIIVIIHVYKYIMSTLVRRLQVYTFFRFWNSVHFTGIKCCGASQLMIFMMVCSQYLIFTSITFCAFVQIRRNIKH